VGSGLCGRVAVGTAGALLWAHTSHVSRSGRTPPRSMHPRTCIPDRAYTPHTHGGAAEAALSVYSTPAARARNARLLRRAHAKNRYGRVPARTKHSSLLPEHPTQPAPPRHVTRRATFRMLAPTHVAKMVDECRSVRRLKVTPNMSFRCRSVRTAYGVSGPNRTLLASCGAHAGSGAGCVFGRSGMPCGGRGGCGDAVTQSPTVDAGSGRHGCGTSARRPLCRGARRLGRRRAARCSRTPGPSARRHPAPLAPVRTAPIAALGALRPPRLLAGPAHRTASS
jgi:hypothetical protein